MTRLERQHRENGINAVDTEKYRALRSCYGGISKSNVHAKLNGNAAPALYYFTLT